MVQWCACVCGLVEFFVGTIFASKSCGLAVCTGGFGDVNSPWFNPWYAETVQCLKVRLSCDFLLRRSEYDQKLRRAISGQAAALKDRAEFDDRFSFAIRFARFQSIFSKLSYAEDTVGQKFHSNCPTESDWMLVPSSFRFVCPFSFRLIAKKTTHEKIKTLQESSRLAENTDVDAPALLPGTASSISCLSFVQSTECCIRCCLEPWCAQHKKQQPLHQKITLVLHDSP